MESIFKEFFPENKEYDIEKKNVENDEIFNIHSKGESCSSLLVSGNRIYILSLKKCGINSGNKLLKNIENLVRQIQEIDYIELYDSSTILLNGIEIDLAFLKILSTGKSWYNKYGYVSDNYNNEKSENDLLRKKFLIEELDSYKKKIVDIFKTNKELSIYILNNKILNDNILKKKNETETDFGDKIDNLKKKLIAIFPLLKLNNNDDNKITIGDFFESIILDNLTVDQTQTVADLLIIIGVFIKYDRDLKKTIGNSNNTNTFNILGGGKIKNKKQTKNNQNETREYGTWKDGSSVYKDKNGYYIYSIRYDDDENSKGEEYKKYLKNWKPTGILYLDESKGGPGKWSSKKPIVGKKNKTLKYKNRPSPPYPANDWCGKNKKGNDGNIYTSKKNKIGVCRWVKV